MQENSKCTHSSEWWICPICNVTWWLFMILMFFRKQIKHISGNGLNDFLVIPYFTP